MLPSFFIALFAPALLLPAIVQGAAQVDKSSVGPLTPLSAKSKICNVLDYGGKADNKTDIGPAISAAFTQCASAGRATLYIPPGSYSLQTGVKLNNGVGYAFQIDGLITLTSNGAFAGNAFVLQNCQDVEVFSSNGQGAINGQGYITRITKSGQNARLFRFINAVNIAIHNIILVDSPTFHLIFNGVSNLEAYHITIRGPSVGGTDGIDVACNDNCYLHDIEVTNRDECIAVKSPSNNILMEDIYCNQSGGMSIGSLDGKAVDNGGEAAAVSNITMRNIYVYQCTQMLMIKTFPGGSGAVGYVKDSLFEDFWAYDTTYALDIDQYWYNTVSPDTGAVALKSLTFNNWSGTVNNGVSRAPIVIRGSAIVPITGISLANFNMWTVNGNKLLNQCKNVYGKGYCAATSTAGQRLTTFTTTQTIAVRPAAYTPPVSPTWGVSGYGITIPIPIYTPVPMWKPVGVSSKAAILSTSSRTAKVTASTFVKSTSIALPTTMIEISSTTANPLTLGLTSKTSSVSSTTKSSSFIKPSSTIATTTKPSAVKNSSTSTKIVSTSTAPAISGT